MRLFETRGERRAKRKIALRTGRTKAQQFISQCRKGADAYRMLAEDALQAGKEEECDRYLRSHSALIRQSARWEKFLRFMEDLRIRGLMAESMAGLVQGIRAMTRELREVRPMISPNKVNRTLKEIHRATERLDDAEDRLTDELAALDESTCAERTLPRYRKEDEALSEEVKRLRKELESRKDGRVPSSRDRLNLVSGA